MSFLFFKYLKHSKILANRELVTPFPPLTQLSALDLLREAFHNTLNHVSNSHLLTYPPQPNPQHPHLYSPQPNNPVIDLLPTIEKSFFFKLSIAFRLPFFRFLYLMNILFPLCTYKDETSRVQIIPPIVTI